MLGQFFSPIPAACLPSGTGVGDRSRNYTYSFVSWCQFCWQASLQWGPVRTWLLKKDEHAQTSTPTCRIHNSASSSQFSGFKTTLAIAFRRLSVSPLLNGPCVLVRTQCLTFLSHTLFQLLNFSGLNDLWVHILWSIEVALEGTESFLCPPADKFSLI